MSVSLVTTVATKTVTVSGVTTSFQTLNTSALAAFLRTLLPIIRALRDADGILLSSTGSLGLVAIMLIKLTRPTKKVIVFDPILKRPTSLKDKLIALLKTVPLRLVDAFIMINKDWSGYIRHYNIPQAKFRYVAFKPNNVDLADKIAVEDKGYALCCGSSQRDIDTLIEAALHTNVAIKILAPSLRALKHNSRYSARSLPSNVQVITEELGRPEWYRYMAESFCLVIPIIEGTIQPAGISVYLEGMFFKKPVIITEGSSTRGILKETMAITVPPSDPAAIGSALNRLKADRALYSSLSSSGYEYALSLGKQERMIREVLELAHAEISIGRSSFREVP